MSRRMRDRFDADPQYYNDDYYASGTTFDRVGSALNSHNLRQTRRRTVGRRADLGNGGILRGPDYANGQIDRNYGYTNGSRRRAPVPPYNAQQQVSPNYNDYAEYGERAARDVPRMERVEQLVYSSAELEGTYYNLDDPKGDVRTYAKAESKANESSQEVVNGDTEKAQEVQQDGK